MKIAFLLLLAVLQLVIWCGLLIPQYNAFRNHCYKTVAICLTCLIVSISSCVGMVVFGDFITAALYGKDAAATASEFVLCVLGIIWVTSSLFCWWYVYGRKSYDFMYIPPYTTEEIKRVMESYNL